MGEDDIKAVLSALGSDRIRTISGGTWVSASCPLAPWLHDKGVDRHPSFEVSVDAEGPSWCVCFTCGLGGKKSLAGVVRKVNYLTGGKFENLVQEVGRREEMNPLLRVERMKYLFRWQDPRVAREEREARKALVSEEILKPYMGRVPRYIVEERGIPLEVCRRYQLGWDERNERVVFPIRDERGRLVGLQGRAVREGVEPIWYNYWNFQKGKYVYGLHDIRGAERLVVMEGVIDVLRWVGFGIEGCVSVLGSRPSEEQLLKIGRKGLPVWMAYDNDESGKKAEGETVEVLQGRVPLYRVRFPEGKDPADLTRREAWAALEERELVL